MLYSEIIKTLNDIENNVAVEKITYKGIRIWPLVRLELWKILHQGNSVNVAKKQSRLKKYLKKLQNSFMTFLEIFLSIFRKYEETDMVFLVSPLERNVKIEGKSYSRFSNSTEELVQELGATSTMLDLARKNLPVYGQTSFLDRQFAWHIKIERIKNMFFKEQADIENWEELKYYLNERFRDLKLPKKNILPLVESVFEYQHFFEKILKKIKPKVAFLVCYYHSAGMGYVRACRNLGIKTVEIQHGEQHGMYRSWVNLPKKGYDTLPDIFWCWGEESARKINEWAQTTDQHQALMVGNPWISKFINKKKLGGTRVEKNEKNILVSIPNKDLSVIENIIESFKHSPKNIKWHFSLHPRRLNNGDRQKLAEKLKQTNNNNFEIKQASTGIIFEILAKMDFLITPWSTVAYEALTVGVHPIITSDEDRAVFEDYVNKELFSIALTSENILEIISKDKSEFNFKEETPYIETDRGKMKKVILDLLGK